MAKKPQIFWWGEFSKFKIEIFFDQYLPIFTKF